MSESQRQSMVYGKLKGPARFPCAAFRCARFFVFFFSALLCTCSGSRNKPLLLFSEEGWWTKRKPCPPAWTSVPTSRKHVFFLEQIIHVSGRRRQTSYSLSVSSQVNKMGKIEWAMWANEQALASGLSEYYNYLIIHSELLEFNELS